jgi:hypothetical protein
LGIASLVVVLLLILLPVVVLRPRLGSQGAARIEEGNDGRFPRITRKKEEDHDHDHDHEDENEDEDDWEWDITLNG